MKSMLPIAAFAATFAPVSAFAHAGGHEHVEGGVLAHMLADAAQIPDALEAFFRKRIARVTRIQAAARANMDLFHHKRPQSPLWLAGKIAPAAVERQLDWLYGHDVTVR